MGALLESGLVGNIGLKHLKVIKEDTINKWDRLGFLDGLKGHLKENVAQLYENQASHLINEATSDGSAGSFETVVFPIVRRVFSKLLANDIVSVQAMNLPIGKLFYFIPKIQGYDGGVAADPNAGVFGGSGDHYAPISSPNNPGQNTGAGYVPADSTGSYNPTYKKNLYDLFYEGTEPELDPPGLFDYSKGRWTAMTVNAEPVMWLNGELVDLATWLAAGNSLDGLNVRKLIVKLCGFAETGVGKMIGPDGNEYDTETFLSDLRLFATGAVSNSNTCGDITDGGCSPFVNENDKLKSLLFRVVTQQYGQGIVNGLYNKRGTAAWGTSNNGGNGGTYQDICAPNGCIYLEMDLSCPVCATCGNDTLDGYTGTTMGDGASETLTGCTGGYFTAVFRRYEELEFEDKIGEVSFDLQSVTVTVTERKLRAQWSPELAQDVAAFHNIDAEAELTALS